MSRVLKKVVKVGTAFIEPTESIESAMAVTTPQTILGQAIGQAIGGFAGIMIISSTTGARAADDGPPADGGLAKDLPSHNVYLAALSSGDIVFFDKSSMSGKVTGLAARVSRDSLAVYAVKKSKLNGQLALGFKDGSTYHADVPMSVGMDELIDVLERHGIPSADG